MNNECWSAFDRILYLLSKMAITSLIGLILQVPETLMTAS